MARKVPRMFAELDGDGTEESPHDQERSFAKHLGGKRHRGSGSSQYAKGDGSSGTMSAFDGFLFDSKQTIHGSMRLDVKMLGKVTREAMAVEKHPVIDVLIKGGDADPMMERRWVAVPLSVFKKILGEEADPD